LETECISGPHCHEAAKAAEHLKFGSVFSEDMNTGTNRCLDTVKFYGSSEQRTENHGLAEKDIEIPGLANIWYHQFGLKMLKTCYFWRPKYKIDVNNLDWQKGRSYEDSLSQLFIWSKNS
jgi:hypothetical protein